MSLQVEDLSVSYGKIRALWNVSVRVGKGEIIALIGSNAAGKSTLLKSIMALVAPESGRVSFDGESILGKKTHSIVSMGLGYVPEGRRLFPKLSIEDNLRMGAPRKCDDLRKRYDQVFKIFPLLLERRSQNTSTLSGGEQQMVAIGRALMGQPKLLLLDELSFGLAPIIFEKVITTIQEINATGVSVLLAEQNAERALEISNFSYVLENGHITISGESRDLINDPKIKSAYLGL